MENPGELKHEDILIRTLKSIILESPELKQLIDERAKQIVQNSTYEPIQDLTRKQLADLWQVSTKTLDRMTDEEILDNGYFRRKRGVAVRFERIKSGFSNKGTDLPSKRFRRKIVT